MDVHLIKRDSQSANATDESTENLDVTDDGGGGSDGNATSARVPGGPGRWFSLVALMMYIAGYAVGFGPGQCEFTRYFPAENDYDISFQTRYRVNQSRSADQ